MENNLSYYEKCLLYLKGEATLAQEKEVLEAKNTDAVNSQEFDETKLLYEGFRIQEKHKAAKALFQKENQLKYTLYRIAIAALLIATSLFAYLGTSKTYFPDFKTRTSVLMSPNPTDEKSSPQENAYKFFVEGKGLYDAQEYDKALLLFKKSLEQPNLRNQLKEAIEWHQCVTLMRAGDFEKASKLFKKLNELEKPKFEVGFLSKTKIRFQIFLKSIF